MSLNILTDIIFHQDLIFFQEQFTKAYAQVSCTLHNQNNKHYVAMQQMHATIYNYQNIFCFNITDQQATAEG